jgi:hypothetical protein
MRGKVRVRFPVCCLAAGILSAGCSLLQTIPVDEQSYLQYQVDRGYGGPSQVTLRFKNAARNMIEVLVERSASAAIPEPGDSINGMEFPEVANFLDSQNIQDPENSSNGNDKILISRFGTQRGGFRYELENLGPLWLPITMLQPGRTLDLEYSGGYFIVEQQTLWNGRQVVTLRNRESENGIKGVLYYSSNTGFLVGFEEEDRAGGTSGNPTLMLAETNIEGLLSVTSK